MSYLALSVFEGDPTTFETSLNLALSTLLSHVLRNVAFVPVDTPRTLGRELRCQVGYATGGATIATPYLAKVFIGQSIADVTTDINAYAAANPTYFFAPPVFGVSSADPRLSKRVVGLLIYNTVLASGLVNWAGGGQSFGLDEVVTDTTTGLTLTNAHNGRILVLNNAAAITLTLPATLPVGFNVVVIQAGAGQVTFTPSGSATLRNRQSHTKAAGQYARTTLEIITNVGGSAAEYILAGDTAA